MSKADKMLSTYDAKGVGICIAVTSLVRNSRTSWESLKEVLISADINILELEYLKSERKDTIDYFKNFKEGDSFTVTAYFVTMVKKLEAEIKRLESELDEALEELYHNETLEDWWEEDEGNMKVFSIEKWLDDVEEYETAENALNHLRGWVVECEGLTPKEMLALGYEYKDSWLKEKPISADLIKKVESWFVERGLDKADPTKQMLKLTEEVGEVASAIARSDLDLIKDGIGDVLVVLIGLSLQHKTTVLECLNLAYNEIKDRKGKVINGVFVKESENE